MPSNSAQTLAIAAREPPMSGWPVVTTTLPSSVMLTCALDSPPALNQKPDATPRPCSLPGGALQPQLQRIHLQRFGDFVEHAFHRIGADRRSGRAIGRDL